MDLYSLPIGRKGVAVRGDGNCFYRVMALAIDGNSDKDDFFCVGIPKVVGSIPTVVRHIFQACPVWIYTQSNITSIIVIRILQIFKPCVCVIQ